MKKIIFTFLILVICLINIKTVNAQMACQEDSHPLCDDDNIWNGYWWENEAGGKAWIPAYPSLETWFRPAPVWAYGTAVYFGPGVMEANAEIREISLEGYVGAIAVMSPADIGLPHWIKFEEKPWFGPLVGVDSAARGDIYHHIKYRNEIIEVDYQTALWAGMGPQKGEIVWKLDNVQVSKINPIYLMTGEPIDYVRWWQDCFEAGTREYVRTPVYEAPSRWYINGEWITFRSPTLEDLISQDQNKCVEEDREKTVPRYK